MLNNINSIFKNSYIESLVEYMSVQNLQIKYKHSQWE